MCVSYVTVTATVSLRDSMISISCKLRNPVGICFSGEGNPQAYIQNSSNIPGSTQPRMFRSVHSSLLCGCHQMLYLQETSAKMNFLKV